MFGESEIQTGDTPCSRSHRDLSFTNVKMPRARHLGFIHFIIDLLYLHKKKVKEKTVCGRTGFLLSLLAAGGKRVLSMSESLCRQ